MLKVFWFAIFTLICSTSFASCLHHDVYRSYEQLQNGLNENNEMDIDDKYGEPEHEPELPVKRIITSILKGVNKSINEMSWQRYFEKVYPGSIPGPKSSTDRIAVVGAGSAGVHMAYLLKKNGFKNITIFEQTNRIGGKSKSVWYRDAVHEMGTCYYAGGYEQIFKLVEEFTESERVDAKNTYLWNTTTAESVPYELTDYITRLVMNDHPGISERDAKLRLVLQIVKYIILHIDIFGISRGQLPPQPKDMKRIEGTFMQFLVRNQVADLQHIMVGTQTLQGYGQLDEVPALYGLMWNTPQLLLGVISTILGSAENSYGVLTKGFQDLWEKIAEKEQLYVLFNSQVSHVEFGEQEDSPINLYISMNGKVDVKEFDFVVWAIPAINSLWSFTGTNLSKEFHLFSKMTHSYYTTSLVNEIGTLRSEAPEDWFYSNIANKTSNLVWANRDSYSVLNHIYGPSYQQGLNETAGDGKEDRTMVVYQYSVSELIPSTKNVMCKIRKHFNAMGVTSYSVVDQNKWLYFPRFSQQQTEEGNHWKALDIQGKKKVWYIGSSMSFESVKSVVEYNLLLINRMETTSPR